VRNASGQSCGMQLLRAHKECDTQHRGHESTTLALRNRQRDLGPATRFLSRRQCVTGCNSRSQSRFHLGHRTAHGLSAIPSLAKSPGPPPKSALDLPAPALCIPVRPQLELRTIDLQDQLCYNGIGSQHHCADIVTASSKIEAEARALNVPGQHTSWRDARAPSRPCRAGNDRATSRTSAERCGGSCCHTAG
jgi:hypothetical protein